MDHLEYSIVNKDHAFSSVLSGWLNNYRETHEEFEIDKYWNFADGTFNFNDRVVDTDENGRRFITFRWKRYYEYQEWMDGLWYKTGNDDERLYIWNFVNGMRDWEWIQIQINSRFEWIFKDNEKQKWKYTIVKSNGDKEEYRIERDEKWDRIVSGENEGKYLIWDEEDENYRIEDREEVWINLVEYWTFDSDGNFSFNDGVENPDEDGRKFIEYNSKKYYEYQDWMDGLWYKVGRDPQGNWSFHIWNFKDGKPDWKWICVWSNGTRYEWNYKEGKRHGRWVCVWSSGNRFEGEWISSEMKRWKYTINQEDIVGEYEIEVDDKWKRIVSGENEGKYLILDSEEGKWKIEDIGSSEDDEGSSEDDEGSDEDNVEDISQGDFDALCEKTSLTVDEAKKLVKFANGNNKSLDLKLTSIDKDVAAELAKSKWENLYLNWLTSIDKDIAAELAKYKWVLYLRWLTSITDDVARELAKQPWTLILPGSILTDEQNNILRWIA